MSLLKRQPTKFANWILAACLALICLFASNSAFAHAGHHGAQPVRHATSAQPQPDLAIERAARPISIKSAHAFFEASIAATEIGPGLCTNSCCHPGASCCAASCLAADAETIPITPRSMTNLPRLQQGSDGIEPGGL